MVLSASVGDDDSMVGGLGLYTQRCIENKIITVVFHLLMANNAYLISRRIISRMILDRIGNSS
jgi:hypothetical protein